MKIGKKDLEKILKDYNLGKLVTYRDFKESGISTQITMFIQTTKGKYIFKFYRTRKINFVQSEISLLNNLKNHRFPAQRPIKNNFGKYIGKYLKKPYVIFEFIEGKFPQNPDNLKNPTKTLANVAIYIAKFHKISKNFKDDKYNLRPSFNKNYLIVLIKNKIKGKRPIWLDNELNNLKFQTPLEKGYCHCDACYTNFIFNKEKFVGLIDLDGGGYTYLIYDLADLIFWWAWPPKIKKINFKLAKYLIKNYNNIRKLSKEEKESFFDVLKLLILLKTDYSDAKDVKMARERILYLNTLGRKKFYQELFRI